MYVIHLANYDAIIGLPTLIDIGAQFDLTGNTLKLRPPRTPWHGGGKKPGGGSATVVNNRRPHQLTVFSTTIHTSYHPRLQAYLLASSRPTAFQLAH
jgi:hypothetical protein